MSLYPLRLPRSLMAAARKAAVERKISMNQLFVTAIAEKLSALETENLLKLKKRAERVEAEAYSLVLAKVPDVPPDDADRIDE